MKASEHSFDLFERRPGWKADQVLVLTPYVEETFFVRLVESLRPKRLSVVIDDGCRPDDVATVTDAVARAGVRKPPDLACVLGSARGLMHLKVFYIVWRTPGGRTARTLVFGSANATRQGFEGTVNAELIARCRLTAAVHFEVIAWCDQVFKATRGKVETRISGARDLKLGQGFHLRLPSIRVGRRRPELGSFDLWVQRGCLLSQYRPEPNFLRVPIHLSKGLSQTEQSQVAASSGFFVPTTRRLNYPFAMPPGLAPADDDDDDDGEAEGGNWRRRLFTWTRLGDWCSEACLVAERRNFRRKGHEARERRLECLETLRSGTVLRVERARFLTALGRLWTDFGSDAPALLRGDSGVDEAFYADLFDKRVERDLSLVSDREFRDRYLIGYELSAVPRFRPDVHGWAEFLESLARQVCLDATRSRSQSRLLAAIRAAIDAAGASADVLDDHDSLLTFLQKVFEDGERGDRSAKAAARIVAGYHGDE